MYKVMCTIGDSDDVFAETLQTEFSGIEHETREEAEKELDEAWEHPAVNNAWIVADEEEPEDDTDDFGRSCLICTAMRSQIMDSNIMTRSQIF